MVLGPQSTTFSQPRDKTTELAEAYSWPKANQVKHHRTHSMNVWSVEPAHIFFSKSFQRSQAALRALRFGSEPVGSSPARINPWPAPS
jgi:hypothetical protein